MHIIVKKTVSQCLGQIIRRNLSRTKNVRSLKETDRTTMHIMNRDDDMGLMIDGYSQVGFRLNNDMTVLGPMVIFTRSVLSWNISDITDVNEDSLSLLKILVPKLDIIVLGTGDRVENHNFFINLLKFSKKYKISFEILPTETACPTFNFLNAEGRNVVGAMIPPKNIRYNEDDQLGTKLRYQNLFEIEDIVKL